MLRVRRAAVSGCSELEELPRMITMASLEELQADGCVKLKNIPQGLVQATNLGYADVSGCSALEELPSMEALGSREKLGAEGYVKKNITRFLA